MDCRGPWLSPLILPLMGWGRRPWNGVGLRLGRPKSCLCSDDLGYFAELAPFSLSGGSSQLWVSGRRNGALASAAVPLFVSPCLPIDPASPVFSEEHASGALRKGSGSQKAWQVKAECCPPAWALSQAPQSYCPSFPGCAPHFGDGVGGASGPKMGTASPKVIYTSSFSNVVGPPPGQGFICDSGEAMEKPQGGEEETWVVAELHKLRELLWRNGTGHLEDGPPCWLGDREMQGPGLQGAGFRPMCLGSSLPDLTSVLCSILQGA